jgi:hypothetical protein
MEFQVGQLIKPITRLHRFGGGTLAMVIPTPSDGMHHPWRVWFLWLNGERAGLLAFECMDMFKVVNK